MLKPRFSKQFHRDLGRMSKRGKNIDKIKAIIRLICDEQALPERHRDHPLKGKWEGHRDCHVEPDWVLIYAIHEDGADFVRTGTHSDLF
ncbi:MAG: type II toxin-antitoxin system YafQ family toxin [Isosphaerales bacterium]